VIPTALLLIDFTRERLADHRRAGDLGHWLGQALPGDLERLLTGPLAASLMDLSRVISRDPQVHGILLQLLAFLLDDGAHPQAFRTTLTAAADTLQLLLDDEDLVPLGRAVGRLLDPERGLVAAGIRLLNEVVQRDAEGILPLLLQQALREQRPGVTPIQVLLDLAGEVHRRSPGHGGPLLGEDLAEVMSQTRAFLADQRSGLINFFTIIKNRCAGPCGAR